MVETNKLVYQLPLWATMGGFGMGLSTVSFINLVGSKISTSEAVALLMVAWLLSLLGFLSTYILTNKLLKRIEE